MPISEEERTLIFSKVRNALQKLSPPFVVTTDNSSAFELIGNKPVPYGYDKKIIPGMYFASIAQRKDSIVFYFFPAYMNSQMVEFAPSLYKCLKGKTCFHFKKKEQVVDNELAQLLESGRNAWIKAGYMK